MSLHYSKLNDDLTSKIALDEYAKFYWAGHDMWAEYHAFIINESKGSLKFYNGPSFSNEYTKPQFESGSPRFVGATFSTQQISFTVGVYAVTEELYRQLIYILHPYEISDLIFAFDTKWRYTVKLSKIGDSARYYLQKDSKGNDLFYTELTLTFDVQGKAVARTVEEYGYKIQSDNEDDSIEFVQINGDNKVPQSFLDTPFTFRFKYKLQSAGSSTIVLKLVDTKESTNVLTCFDLTLKNTTDSDLTFFYNSETGELLYSDGEQYSVLSLLTTASSGLRIVNALETNIVVLPGTVRGVQNWDDYKLTLIGTNCTLSYDSTEGLGLNCFGRVNLI